MTSSPTIDLDPTDVEVYGAKKQGCAYNSVQPRVIRDMGR